jgi:GTP cyclohydrolase I
MGEVKIQAGTVPVQKPNRAAAIYAIEVALGALGYDIGSEAIKDTPRRVVDALLELTRGVNDDPAAYLARVFEAQHEELVLVRRIEFVSVCEHHLLPFTGSAAVAYIPTGKVVGLSKIARVVDAYARRLQLQERLTGQIADALEQHLQPKGVAVVIDAGHACMNCRGVYKPSASMVTSAMRGVFRENAAARAEVLELMR